MIIEINTDYCFECGYKATEFHHIIPQVFGGTKTVPLCSSCHMKVHGIKSGKRIDNHVENTKRGIDRKRVWELFSGWIIIKKYNFDNRKDFKEYYYSIFGKTLSYNKIYSIYERLNQLEDDFLLSLFKNEMNSTLISFFIDENEFKVIDEKIINLISKNIKNNVGTLGKPKNLTKQAIKNGVKKRKQKALIDPINIENIRYIVKQKNKGLTFYEITKAMNEIGLKTRSGKPMNQVQCKRLFEKSLNN
ncbi:HNH endonuclease [Psychroserpens jangbogonensis]|uniref:HNH endonuclease n=1 Tax=Psychroserpens jangbogonensis TaxID=1484460 RepID=UPI00053EA8B2|nr:HNH endonuclease [Psychroserpens jangbogonensis]